MKDIQRMVIAGAGFGGLETVLSLKKKLGKDAEIIVIDKSDCCLYTPELYHYLVGKRKKDDITYDLAEKLEKKEIDFRQERIEKIDTKEKKIKTDASEIEYDYLVLSLGSEINKLDIKGSDNAVGFKTIGHANKIKENLDVLDKNKRVTIIGCGLISVELASFIKEHYKKNCPKISMIGKELMPGFSEKIKNKVREDFRKKGIEIIEKGKAEELVENEIKCKIKKADKTIKSDLTIMSTGFKIPEIAKGFGLEHNNRGIKVNEFFETSEKGIFAIGDCTFLEQTGDVEKKRAQIAEKEGKHLAKNIYRELKGKEKIPYKVEKIPTIISTAPTFILDYKGLVFKSKLVNLMEKFIKVKHMFR